MNPQPKETNPSFFKVLIGNFSDKLRIPPAFAKKHMKSIPKASILKTRGAGKLFLVSVISNEEGCFFGRGWHKFVEDNQLIVGDFLVFHFLSGSKFEVTIYDKTACEKTLKETGGIQEQGSSVQESGEEPEHACFEHVLKTCQNEHNIVMPETFARETGLMRKKMTVFKDPRKRVWSIGIRVRGSGKGREISFSGGEVSEFVAANRLVAGDKCIFHFRNGTDSAIHVEIPDKVVGIGHITEMSAQQRYWTEFEATRHQFLKVMVKDFGNQLKIPIKFVENFKEDLPDTIYLRGPNGHVWPVTLTKGVDSWVLEGGWTDFVREHGVRETYFLVFRYEGNHVFRVTIFDQTTCEKEDCYFIQNQTSATENVNKIRKRKMEAGESRRGPSDSTSKQKKKYTMYLLSNRRLVSEEEKWRAFQLADAYTKSSTLPSFIKVMMPTQVHHYFVLNCPKQWGRDHIPNIDNMEIELRVPQLQIKWPVTLKNHKWKFGISKGWFRFVEDNNLEEDDVCVFELKQGGNNSKCKQNIIFDVSIYRVVDEIVPLTAYSAI